MADEANTGTQQPNPAAGSTQPNAEGTQPQASAPDAGVKPAEGQGSKASSEDGAKPDAAKPAEGATKPDGTKPDGEGGDGTEGEVKTDGAPESYEAFNVPEGFTLAGERLTKFQELAKASGWNQAQAQAVINDFVTNVREDMASQQSALTEAWAKDLKADPQFGGQAYETNLAVAGQAVARFGGQPLIDLLNELGIGNHPVLARTFLAIGKATSEGSVPGLGSAPAAEPKSLAERLYGAKK